MDKIIGREREKRLLDEAFAADRAEFIVVYGRRRVGKTYLIRHSFYERKHTAFFYITGIKDASLTEQLEHAIEELTKVFHKVLFPTPKNWKEFFFQLDEAIKAAPQKKIVLFFDEFPWMVTPKSRLLQMLEHYWNHKWSWDGRIKLIVCGSSAGWIIKKIINSTGGLYNRVTQILHVEPFSLYQTKKYLEYRKIKLGNKQITQLYMVLGGIPHYLSHIKQGDSAIQSIEKLAFGHTSFLLKEFKNLYDTLFGVGDGHIELARLIAEHPYGIGQNELATVSSKISSGAGLISRLEDLVEAGFIQRFRPYKAQKKGIFYKMSDEYSIFYFHWIEPIKDTLLERGMSKGYWESKQTSAAWSTWAGYAFESICYKHIPLISEALHLSPTAISYNWRYAPKKGSTGRGAQIDLLFDREDHAITLCEIKYTREPFIIDKDYYGELKRKIEIFKERTSTSKDLFLAFVSAQGLKQTIYSEEIVTGLVVLDDLFKPVWRP